MSMTYRPLTTQAECAACVDIQRAAWGGDDLAHTSTALLMATAHSGGIVSGAVTPGGEVVGFVYSFIGQGELAPHPYHWSHQMAVLPAYEGQGIAYGLKAHQRQQALAQGIDLIAWTFDPMMSINAHFNLNKLGAICRVYRRDAYGPMSGINAGRPSDRFDCLWWLNDTREGQSKPHSLTMWRKAGAMIVNPTPDLTPPTGTAIPPYTHALLIAIPTHFPALPAEQGQAWQLNVRACFEAAFTQGFVAYHFIRGETLGYYVLLKER